MVAKSFNVGDSPLTDANPGPSGSRPPWWVFTLAVVALAYVAVPLIGLLLEVQWRDLGEQLSSSESLTALRLSLLTSVAATIVVIIVGLPLAWVLARVSFPGRSFVRSFVLLPMVLPPVVAGVALLAAFGRNSAIGGWLYDVLGVQLTFSPAGVVVAQTFVAMPFFVVAFEAALLGRSSQPEEVASSLGAGSWRVFTRITFPAVAPVFFAAVALAWARALGEFGATITFAGNVAGRTQTAPLGIYLQLGTDPAGATAMSVLLLAISVGILVGLRGRWLVSR